jgi:hypothetical protein
MTMGGINYVLKHELQRKDALKEYGPYEMPVAASSAEAAI